jgi:hypothetical protein
MDEKDRNLDKIKYDRAVALYSLGENQIALDEFSKLSDMRSQEGMIDLYRMLIHAKMGNKKEAQKDLERFEINQSKLSWKAKFYHWEPAEDQLFPKDPQTVYNSKVIAEKVLENLDLSWSSTRLPTGVRDDNFAVVASTQIRLSSEPYSITIECDDGIRIWLDDKLLLEKWEDDQFSKHTVTLDASPGLHQLKIEYCHAKGNHNLSWNSPMRDNYMLIDYARVAVPTWLDDLAEAKNSFLDALSRRNSVSASELYNLACVGSILVSRLPKDGRDHELFAEHAIDALELWIPTTTSYRKDILHESDFEALREHPRSLEILSTPTNIPRTSFWIAANEVKRKDFQAFLDD